MTKDRAFKEIWQRLFQLDWSEPEAVALRKAVLCMIGKRKWAEALEKAVRLGLCDRGRITVPSGQGDES